MIICKCLITSLLLKSNLGNVVDFLGTEYLFSSTFLFINLKQISFFFSFIDLFYFRFVVENFFFFFRKKKSLKYIVRCCVGVGAMTSETTRAAGRTCIHSLFSSRLFINLAVKIEKKRRDLAQFFYTRAQDDEKDGK